MEAHGGYLCRLESLDGLGLMRLASRALAIEGHDPSSASLQVSVIPRRKVVRLAYDAPFTYGRRGAGWYEHHHALAELISAEMRVTVHAYVLLPELLEEVVGYGNGRKVGGERLIYDEVESDSGPMDDASFAKLQSRWPLGHLAYVFGVTRDELLALPRTPSALLPLDGSEAPELTRLLRPNSAA